MFIRDAATHGRDGFFGEGARGPRRFEPSDIEQKRREDVRASRRMHDFRMKRRREIRLLGFPTAQNGVFPLTPSV